MLMGGSLHHTAGIQRNRQLDGLRGVAILWVIAYHLLAVAGMHPVIASLPIVPGLLRIGWVGVMIFFALSGYLITRHLVETKGRPGYFVMFVSKRAARILPIYGLLLVALPVAAAFWNSTRSIAVFNDAIPFWSHFLFLQNIPMAISGGLGNGWLRVTWSLAVEVQYYAFIVVVAWMVPTRRLLLVLILVTLSAVAFRYWIRDTELASAASMVLTPCRMDSFALAGLVALADRHSQSKVYLRTAVALGSVGILLFLAFAEGFFGQYRPAVTPLYYTFAGIACAAVVAIAVARTKVLRILEVPSLVNIGRTSYFLYIFHMPIALACYELFRHTVPEGGNAIGLGVALLSFLLCWFLANVSWRYLESPAISCGNAWLKKRYPT
jgi:peptidoglycan/LPS O-acetylase OafA/YrhL